MILALKDSKELGGRGRPQSVLGGLAEDTECEQQGSSVADPLHQAEWKGWDRRVLGEKGSFAEKAELDEGGSV